IQHSRPPRGRGRCFEDSACVVTDCQHSGPQKTVLGIEMRNAVNPPVPVNYRVSPLQESPRVSRAFVPNRVSGVSRSMALRLSREKLRPTNTGIANAITLQKEAENANRLERLLSALCVNSWLPNGSIPLRSAPRVQHSSNLSRASRARARREFFDFPLFFSV